MHCSSATASSEEPTNLHRLFQTCVGDEADCGMESFGMFEDVQGQGYFFSCQLRFNAFQGVLYAEPKIDFLRSGSRRDVSRQLGDGLDLLDPRVDVRLKLVEESRIGKQGLGFYRVDGDSATGGMTLSASETAELRCAVTYLCYRLADGRMDG